jgi:glycosyltransferase involved in cell wall biosynthesis
MSDSRLQWPAAEGEHRLAGRWTFEAPLPSGPVSEGPVPTFSVIIPAYEASAYIAGAVRSALEQTAPPLEVIVCDDGSRDDVAHALDFAAGVVVLRQEHAGVASARNTALAAAAGDFVAMLDADDAFHVERLEALGALAAARPDLDILCSDLSLEVDGVVRGRFHETTPFAVDDQRVAILERCFCPVSAIRRRRLLEIGGFDESLAVGSDWECLIRLILAGCSAGNVSDVLYHYRLRRPSLTSDRVEALRGRIRFLEKTSGHPGLRPPEIRALGRSLAAQRRSLLLTEAELSLRMHQSNARRLALRVARTRGFSIRERLAALLAVLAPRTSARVLERRARTRGSHLDRPIERGRKRLN